MPLTPILTFYNGYRFRSRTEARWAVFFDALGIICEYEKEGYKLDGAGYYLPDFWLPELDCFIEVKGESPKKDSLEFRKCKQLAVESGKNVYMVFNCQPYTVIHGDYGDIKFLGSNRYFYPDGDSDGRYSIGYCASGHYAFGLDGKSCDYCGNWMEPKTEELINAYNKARSARFEFGECGQ
jgi:hypothetical protein